ncbi:MAG: CBS domain-containing protein, partial [Myxococcales bacterium]|nr:CBS domain-containing protein [Myxococcales bacterium]
GRFHSLPVVDDGKLVGLVTSTDVIKYLLAQY